jgi:hopanoid biosynthesis associated protein HpnK
VIITADDFGFAPEINDAVEVAHQDGILTAASLIVAGPAAKDAITRARRLPRLHIGLHLVLVDGQPVLPPRRLPDLVDETGRFRNDMARLGVNIFARASVRRQIAAEIEAQFEAYRATGLALDHVNAHKHFHLHPTVASTIFAIGARYGMRALRVPLEPRHILIGIEPLTRQRSAYITAMWAAALGRRARLAGLRVADSVFGLAWSGAMTELRLCSLLRSLSEGCTEIYLHPATSANFAGYTPGYRYTDELAALKAPAVVAITRRQGLALGGYSDF